MVQTQTVTAEEREINELKAKIARLEATKHVSLLETNIANYARTIRNEKSTDVEKKKVTEALYAVSKSFCNTVERAKRQEAKNEE